MTVARNAVVVVLIALISVMPVTAQQQEEALPVVRARASVAAANPSSYAITREEPTVFLAVEPIHDFAAPTLAEAARDHDYVTFHALYTRAVERGENVHAWETLHELWTYSITSPIGAFYGPEMRDRLARAYPGFGEFIEDHRIVDSNGQVFYPTAETRDFLLQRAERGQRASRSVSVPRSASAEPPPSYDAAQPRRATTERAATTTTTRSTRKTTTPKARATTTTTTRTAPKVTPAVAEAAPRQNSAAAVPPHSEVTTAPAIDVVPTTTVAQSLPPAPVAAPKETAVAKPVEQPAGNNTSRGIFLLLIGLAGIGVLAMLVRTPKNERPTARPKTTTATPVEPIRSSGETAKKKDVRRANGSRG